MRTIAIIGTDIHGIEDWWLERTPEENPTLAGGRLRFDRAHEPSMKNQYLELAEIAEVDGIAVGLRSLHDTDAVAHMPLFSRVVQEWDPARLHGRPAPTMMPFIDTVGLMNLVRRDWTDGETPVKFDYANPEHVARFWPEYLKVFYDTFPEQQDGAPNPIAYERTPDGRPLMLFWGVKHSYDDGQGTTNEAQAQRLLDHITEHMVTSGYGQPAFIVDVTWLEAVNGIEVHGYHAWHDPSGKDAKGNLLPAVARAHSIRTHKGVTVGLTVPGFYDPPPGTRRTERNNGETLRGTLAAMRKARADYVFIESYNNRTECAGLYRTDAWGTRELDTVRAHIRHTKGESMIAVSKDPLIEFVAHEQLLPGCEAETFALRWPNPNSDTVLSLQPDGTLETRPATAIGPWESAKKKDGKLVFRSEGAVKVFSLIEDI